MEETELLDRLNAIRNSSSDPVTRVVLTKLIKRRWGNTEAFNTPLSRKDWLQRKEGCRHEQTLEELQGSFESGTEQLCKRCGASVTRW